ncbi:hypothetical protein ACFVVC_05040 [Pseudarthrobacter sp. NPDC058196]|uniref:hypothetical protein n=1 Tax=Pseudarthrobacter sp. NPDC058196 TaxID=3346376 RepID=UPI0036DD6631
MGLITDSCTAAPPTESRTSDDPASQSADPLKTSKISFDARAEAVRKAVSGARWAGAIHSLS